METIFHHFIINNPVERVYEEISTPEGLDNWWSLNSSGTRETGAQFCLFFGKDFNWKATVTKLEPNKIFELTITEGSEDWIGSKVGFVLKDLENQTEVRFYHRGWPKRNQHFKISSYCWAMYLRILKRYLEYGEEVEYERRLEA